MPAEAKIEVTRMWLQKAFQDLRQAAVTLTPYAVSFRYPGDLPELTIQEAELGYALAQQVWDFLIAKLPRETHPN